MKYYNSLLCTLLFSSSLYTVDSITSDSSEIFNNMRNNKIDQSTNNIFDTVIKHDKHAQVLNPIQYKKLNATIRGEFYGTGIILSPEKTDHNGLLILGAQKNSPAYHAGIQKQDRLIEIHNKNITHLSLDHIIELLKSESSSFVDITIIRQNKVIHMHIKRDRVYENHVAGYLLKRHNIAYICIDLFTDHVSTELEVLIKKINLQKINGIVLDLRDNIGGLLESAVSCAALFLPEHSLVVQIKNNRHAIIDRLITQRKPIIPDYIPIVILINQQTSSAAEILAGSLHQQAQFNALSNKLVFLVGIQTYGKGSIQEIIPFQNNNALKITTGLYCLPKGNCIDGIGLTPDFVIEPKHEASEPKLQDREHLFDLFKNNQFRTGLQLINIINLAKQAQLPVLRSHAQACTWLKQQLFCDQEYAIEEIL
jgi:carboxyl-terminal processing protease